MFNSGILQRNFTWNGILQEYISNVFISIKLTQDQDYGLRQLKKSYYATFESNF